MASVNKVILIGRLGADPELRYTPNGNKAVCNLRLATSEVYKDKSGQRQEKTEWHRINVWGPQAEACAKYLAKGREIYVDGRLETRSWDDKSGEKKYSTEIVANEVKFLGSGDGQRSSGGGQSREQAPGGWKEDVSNPGAGIDDSDIPF